MYSSWCISMTFLSFRRCLRTIFVAGSLDTRAQDRVGTETNVNQTKSITIISQSMKYISHHHTVGDNVQNQRKKELYKHSAVLRTRYIAGKRNQNVQVTKNPTNVSSLPPYKECTSPSTKIKKEEKNPKTESHELTQSVDDTQHEQKSDYAWCSYNLQSIEVTGVRRTQFPWNVKRPNTS